MHMADALLSPAVGGALWAVSGTAIALGSRRMKASLDHRQVPLMGVMGALVFATQMLNFAIPGTGSSGHFAGGLLLAILLGPQAAFLTIASVITVQCLFFADGGLLALGANIFNMGGLACFVVYPLVYKPLARWNARWATVLAAVLALQLGAFSVVLETSASGIADLPFPAFLLAMLPIHLAIGLVEGLITLAVVEFITKLEPEMLKRSSEAPIGKRVLTALAVLAVLSSGLFSWFASSRPDGLEWSIASLTGAPTLQAPEDKPHVLAQGIQAKTAFLPDYALPSASSQTPPEAGTTLSGLVGGGIVLLIVLLAGFAFRRRPETAA